MKRLEKAGLVLNRSKCVLYRNQVTFLGHRVSDKSIAPDPEKVKAIIKMGAPTDRKEIESFLEMVNYLSKFSPKLAEIERPLREWTKTILLFPSRYHPHSL